MRDEAYSPITHQWASPNSVRRASADRTAGVVRTAAEHADAVDRDARLPDEALSAAKQQGLLSLLVPVEFGGDGATLTQAAEMCFQLGTACSATAMIVAMHQCCVACLVRHGRESAWHRALLRRIADEQLLFASSTTEGRAGGDIRSSQAAVEQDGARIGLHREATVLSYGAHADGIVSTARRAPDALPSDQVMVAFCREDYTLRPSATWDALGMRGTCSAGFDLHAEGWPEQVLPEPYDRIHAMTVVPVHHLLWSSVWTGIAAAALARAQAFVRRAARGRSDGALPPGAAQLTQARSSLTQARAVLHSSLRLFEANAEAEGALRSLDLQTRLNLTKVQTSELAVATVLGAARATGLAGYRNDSEFSVGRHVRDILSAPIMIHNDRILGNLVSASALSAVPDRLSD